MSAALRQVGGLERHGEAPRGVAAPHASPAHQLALANLGIAPDDPARDRAAEDAGRERPEHRVVAVRAQLLDEREPLAQREPRSRAASCTFARASFAAPGVAASRATKSGCRMAALVFRLAPTRAESYPMRSAPALPRRRKRLRLSRSSPSRMRT